ncbi:MAG: hypothetical protein PUB21_05930 [Bacteroidales bacterium]|nr:hypothetical protein [Bacteroidales bacterium]
MKNKLLLLTFLFLAIACKREGSAINYVYEGKTVLIKRFDKALMDYLTKDPSIRDRDTSLFMLYPDFSELYINHVIPIEKKDTYQEAGKELVAFFSDPTLFYLYKDALIQFSSTLEIERELSSAFSFLSANLPETKLPQIYFHISGLNQNVIAGENILSLSIDKYLGEKYPLYQDIFYDYQRKTMTDEQAAIDLTTGFLLSEFPYNSNEEVLLNKILYWGKIKYILSKTFPQKDKLFIMNYTADQWNWCSQNEKKIWKQIVGKKYLYSNDRLLIAKFTEPAPYTVPLGENTPPMVGVWLGWQIINSYMEHHPNISIQSLLEDNDYAKILKEASYRP